MKTFELNEAVKNPQPLIDYLTYSCYAYNRDISPQHTPEQWKSIFSNVDAMEAQYQSEKLKLQKS